jgi:hypothetical protein
MKIIRLFFTCALLTILLSCNSNKTENKQIVTTDSLETFKNKVSYERTEKLNLSLADTLKKTASYFFSNQQSEDLFILTIEPGLIKNSKSSLKIITTDNRVIYKQTFDSYYFIKWIYEPDTIPNNLEQEGYEKYLESYWKSITPKQYETHFKKKVDNFFKEIYPIEEKNEAYLKNWEEDIKDQAFFQEILADNTIKLFDITCFDCDEGGEIIGYSRKQNKVVRLFEHD